MTHRNRASLDRRSFVKKGSLAAVASLFIASHPAGVVAVETIEQLRKTLADAVGPARRHARQQRRDLLRVVDVRQCP